MVDGIEKVLETPGEIAAFVQTTRDMSAEDAKRVLNAKLDLSNMEHVINVAYLQLKEVTNFLSKYKSDLPNSLSSKLEESVRLADLTSRYWTDEKVKETLIFVYALGDIGKSFLELDEIWKNEIGDVGSKMHSPTLTQIGFVLIRYGYKTKPEHLNPEKIDCAPVYEAKRILTEVIGISLN